MLLLEDKEVDIFVASKIGSFKHIKYHTDTTKNSKKNTENLVDIKTLQKDEGITRLEKRLKNLAHRRTPTHLLSQELSSRLAAAAAASVGVGPGVPPRRRLYDSRAQRRPVISVDFEKMAATCITNSFDERQVLVGFGRGQLHQVDLRKGKPDRGYKGCVGAVSDISVVRERRLIVSCSLDRHMRVHDYNSKELVYKQYLTSKLSCVLVQTESSTPLTKVESEIKEEVEDVIKVEADDGDDLDHLFDKMETVGEKPKRPKQTDIEELPAKKIKPSSDGRTDVDIEENTEDAIKKLLKSTEKLKRKRDQKKREKKAKSVFHNA
ncbi:hypothetical protein B5X24_HaOG214944 [Helicoverpa armigera]|uniref:WD repeat-containing protein 74 n=1 Tax=Helicoverpa armigera TaxID=29058 RepID=A0A2W1B195_HELAM|nr:hypothetical protein B5X24_HaOG214944 [Helicoverpa armigera]